MVAFWLTPAAGAREFFESVISQLGQHYDAPRFEPHVTLCGGDLAPERALEILRNLSIREAIELEVEGIEFTDKYTKTLFVQFKATPHIEALSNELKKAAESDYQLNPHLSLLYKEMPNERKAEAAHSISQPFTTVKFELIKAIVTPSPITSAADIAVWRTLASRRLDTAPE